jgi:hypothetical protein
MNRTIRFVGLVLASLTISTVAMAQQGSGNGGGGRGGDGGGNGGSGSGGGDPSILQVLREAETAKPRLTRAVQNRASPNCITHACAEEPPPPPRRPRHPPVERHEMAQADAACAGGEVFAVRSRGGMIVRYFCEMP